MARITRKESHAQTRERLVETAYRLFMADGYNATSLDKVAAEAGFSKGAVYSNFATKTELGLAVLDVLHLERAMSLAAAVLEAETAEDRIAGFAKWADENIGDVGWGALEVEFATSNRNVPGVNNELASRRRLLTAALGDLLEQQATDLGLVLPMPAEDAATQLLALGIGLGLQRAFDPELPVTGIVDQLRSLLERSTPIDPSGR
ncbi:TetR/AcrR family transcriptional regulator [Nocardioides humilatus]|uniref:TetR/AcrR family transcriptional regulator n=1 Tax=Nocardioides humilatus TaxID=2607660 RepID=A0A5B1LHL2_9ACTN|nr:TetR/AcrR family transcriptional regulator [Nocardioides humilatus]KAA1419290.1 TetR/AcrR family transcriptional regulator [Nocardioides humilatus]